MRLFGRLASVPSGPSTYNDVEVAGGGADRMTATMTRAPTRSTATTDQNARSDAKEPVIRLAAETISGGRPSPCLCRRIADVALRRNVSSAMTRPSVAGVRGTPPTDRKMAVNTVRETESPMLKRIRSAKASPRPGLQRT